MGDSAVACRPLFHLAPVLGAAGIPCPPTSLEVNMPYCVCRVFGCCTTVAGDGVSCPTHADWIICPACWTWPVLKRARCARCSGREWLPPRLVVRELRRHVSPWWLERLLHAALDGEPLELAIEDEEVARGW